MEDIDGGLHPAVDGQSLDEDEDEAECVRGSPNCSHDEVGTGSYWMMSD